jgi:transcription antitermination factor NusG
MPYEPGLSRVRVISGPFAGAEGTISRVKGGTRLTIPVQILNRSVAVEIDAADTEILK